MLGTVAKQPQLLSSPLYGPTKNVATLKRSQAARGSILSLKRGEAQAQRMCEARRLFCSSRHTYLQDSPWSASPASFKLLPESLGRAPRLPCSAPVVRGRPVSSTGLLDHRLRRASDSGRAVRLSSPLILSELYRPSRPSGGQDTLRQPSDGVRAQRTSSTQSRAPCLPAWFSSRKWNEWQALTAG